MLTTERASFQELMAGVRALLTMSTAGDRRMTDVARRAEAWQQHGHPVAPDLHYLLTRLKAAEEMIPALRRLIAKASEFQRYAQNFDETDTTDEHLTLAVKLAQETLTRWMVGGESGMSGKAIPSTHGCIRWGETLVLLAIVGLAMLGMGWVVAWWTM